ncbi:MAG: hypothetical protein ABIH35_04530 [Patescibacteria group bacterium]
MINIPALPAEPTIAATGGKKVLQTLLDTMKKSPELAGSSENILRLLSRSRIFRVLVAAGAITFFANGCVSTREKGVSSGPTETAEQLTGKMKMLKSAEAASVKESSAIAHIPDRTKESFQLGQDKDVRNGPVQCTPEEQEEQKRIYNKMGIAEMRLMHKEPTAGIIVYDLSLSNGWKVLMAFPEDFASGKTASEVNLHSPRRWLENVIGRNGRNLQARVVIGIKPEEDAEYKFCEPTPDGRALFGAKLKNTKTGKIRYRFYVAWLSEDGKRWAAQPAKAKNGFTVKTEDKYVHIEFPKSPNGGEEYVEYQKGKKSSSAFVPELKHRINIPAQPAKPAIATKEKEKIKEVLTDTARQ